MLINRTYFVGEINIPNVDKAPVSELLDLYIQKYEIEYLVQVLGEALYKDFVTGARVKPMPVKWERLLYGHEYTKDNVLHRWDGLIITGKRDSLTLEDDSITKTEYDESVDSPKSPIAHYVYYWFMRQQFTATSGIGEVTPQGENSTPSGPGFKMAHAWNQMINYTWSLYAFLDHFPDDYSSWYASPTVYYNRFFKKTNTFGI